MSLSTLFEDTDAIARDFLGLPRDACESVVIANGDMDAHPLTDGVAVVVFHYLAARASPTASRVWRDPGHKAR